MTTRDCTDNGNTPKRFPLRCLFTAVLTMILVWGVALAAHAAAEDLDPTFDGDGIVTTDICEAGEYVRASSLQDDGKIVVAGHLLNPYYSDTLVVRYNTDGSLDNSFGTDGVAITEVSEYNDGANDIALKTDGKIVVVGDADMGSTHDFVIIQYNNDGSLDTTFDDDGIVTTSYGSGSNYGYGVAIQDDGKIVLGGKSSLEGNTVFTVARYNSDGSLDSSFDTDGIVTTYVGSTPLNFGDLALQNDGKIVAVGGAYNGSHLDVKIVRYNSDGSLDTTFGSNGILTSAIGTFDSGANAVAIQANGKIVITGISNNGSHPVITVIRYNDDGSFDTTFGLDGIVTTPIGDEDEFGQDVAIQSDGKIVVTGKTESENGADIAVIRYNTDGSLDTTFSSDGIVITSVSTDDDIGSSVDVQSDGKIVVAGYSEYYSEDDYDLTLIRYLSNGSFNVFLPLVLK